MTPAAIARPQPPAQLLELGAAELFVPDLGLVSWIRRSFIAEHGPLYFEGHAHLWDAEIGALWTNVANSRHQRRIVGQAELVENLGGRAGAWQRARMEQQLREWFDPLPDFLLTFDALYAAGTDDVSFCALVDHELCHCAQATNEMGAPVFRRDSGKAKYAMRGHDVEEFVSVVQRFGIEAAGERAVDFVLAAAAKPAIGPARIGDACGTCVRLVA